METTSEVIALKQKILREAPASARQVAGVDKIYYRKAPGYDAWLSGSGTVSYREGFGAAPHPTRYGGVVAADRALRMAGYRPYDIFTGNEYQMNETRHKMAREDKQRQQTVFVPTELPKINVKRDTLDRIPSSDYIEYPAMEIKQQNIDIAPQKVVGQKKASYFDVVNQLPDALADSRALKRRMQEQIYGEDAFAKMMQKKYSLYQATERQIGLRTLSQSKQKKYNKKKGKKGDVSDGFNI